MNSLLLQNVVADFARYAPKIPSVLLLLFFGVFAIRLLQRFVGRVLTAARLDRTLVNFVNAFLAFASWVFLVSLAFSVLGFPQISLAFSGSIALLLVGIASNANSLIQDLLAGLFLIAEPDFRTGANVRVNNVSGKVVGLDIKKTKIRDADGNIHVVSNKVFDNSIYVIEKK